MAFVKADTAVFYNAKNHRQDPLVLLVVGTKNLDHFEVMTSQRNHYKVDKGFLVCNGNYAIVGLAISFTAIEAAFGPMHAVSVVREQALSGERHSASRTNVG